MRQLIVFALFFYGMYGESFAQSQDNLCQGAHWTEVEAARMMEKFASNWDDRASWEAAGERKTADPEAATPKS